MPRALNLWETIPTLGPVPHKLFIAGSGLPTVSYGSILLLGHFPVRLMIALRSCAHASSQMVMLWGYQRFNGWLMSVVLF